MGPKSVWFQYHSYRSAVTSSQSRDSHTMAMIGNADWRACFSFHYFSTLSCAQILEAKKAALVKQRVERRNRRSISSMTSGLPVYHFCHSCPIMSNPFTSIHIIHMFAMTSWSWFEHLTSFVMICHGPMLGCSGAAWLWDRSGHWYSKLDTLCQLAFHLWTLWTSSLTAFAASQKQPKPCRRTAWQSNWKEGTNKKNANHLSCKLHTFNNHGHAGCQDLR